VVQPLPSAGPDVFFALHRAYSAFDDEVALRPYVFRVEGERTVDLWRGTSLAFPIVAARVIYVDGRALLCALHRGHLRGHDADRGPLRRLVYDWNGFGFTSVDDARAVDVCRSL